MTAATPPGPRVRLVGMVGAGQLARMTAQAAIGLGIGFRVLAGAADESAAQVWAGTQIGDYQSAADVLAFGSGCDVVTFDHEHVPGPHLTALERAVDPIPTPPIGTPPTAAARAYPTPRLPPLATRLA